MVLGTEVQHVFALGLGGGQREGLLSVFGGCGKLVVVTEFEAEI